MLINYSSQERHFVDNCVEKILEVFMSSDKHYKHIDMITCNNLCGMNIYESCFIQEPEKGHCVLVLNKPFVA